MIDKMCVQQIGNKQNIVITEKYCCFFSYNSYIANYNFETKKLVLFNNWDYSRTTLKYLYKFLRDFTCYEYKNKKEIEKALKNKEIEISEK